MQAKEELNSHLERVKYFHDLDAPQYTKMRYQNSLCEGIAYVTRRKLVLDFLNQTSATVLDIGCGPGILTENLLEKGLKVYSTDLSIEMIKQAKNKALQNPSAEKAYFAVNDASNLPFSNKELDIVLCIGVMCYVKDYLPVLSEIHRVLKPGGEAIVQVNKIRFPGLYEKLVPFYHLMKSKLTGKKYDQINFDFNYFDYREFVRDAELMGFQVDEFQYFDFRIPFIDVLLPKFSVAVGKFMFKNRHKKLMRYFAFGLLIKMRK